MQQWSVGVNGWVYLSAGAIHFGPHGYGQPWHRPICLWNLPVVVVVNKRWSDCKGAVLVGKIRLCRGTRSSASHTSEARATQVLSSKGPAATGPFHDSLRYPLLLIFPPDRVEVPGNAGHIHREAQDFKKQVHRLHPNRRSERCPQADSAAGIILPHGPRR